QQPQVRVRKREPLTVKGHTSDVKLAAPLKSFVYWRPGLETAWRVGSPLFFDVSGPIDVKISDVLASGCANQRSTSGLFCGQRSVWDAARQCTGRNERVSKRRSAF